MPKMSFFAFTAIAILVIATPSENSQAEGTPEQRCACEQDAFRVCGNEIPYYRLHGQECQKVESRLPRSI
jgi:hypothetical protein